MTRISDDSLDRLLRSSLQADMDPPEELNRDLLSRISDGEKKSIRILVWILVINAFLTLFSESLVILFIPITAVRILSLIHIILALVSPPVMIRLERKFPGISEGVRILL